MDDENVVSMVNRRKIKALEANLAELAEVTTILRGTMQNLSKYNHYSNIRTQVNNLFSLYNDVKQARSKKLEILERLKNE